MSLRQEQYRALKRSQEFLRTLLDPKLRPKTVKEMKEQAYSCLRHFPYLKTTGEPIFSNDSFTA